MSEVKISNPIIVTVATAGTAVAVSTIDLFVNDFEMEVPAANTGVNCFIGNSAVDNTTIRRTNAGGPYNFVAGHGDLGEDSAFNLANVFIDADTSGDTVVIVHHERGAF